jgi:formylglycine-generating enzyme required for sulfatase activity
MTNCGSDAGESCCTSLEVPGTDGGAPYYRTYTNTGTPPVTGEADPATVSGFRLDKYMVTVGRFRQFAAVAVGPDGGAGWTPPPRSGKHTHLNGGQGLVDSSSLFPDGGPSSYEPGWVATDDSQVSPTSANLGCSAQYSTWTAAPGSQETLPINCTTWQEAYAFCIWDGGFLPSESEWQYVWAAGNQELEFPWGSLQPDHTCPGTGCEYAIYGCLWPNGSGDCTGVTNIAPVGAASLGAAAWGQLDMAGNLWEWNVDWYNGSYVDPCVDCAYFNPTPGGDTRVIRGGYFFNPTVQDDESRGGRPEDRSNEIGFRCARLP